KFTRDNEAVLAKANIPITDATRYLAHFLGAGGAVRLLSAAPGSSAAAAAGPQATAANPTILGGGRTVQDVIDWANRKMAGAGARVDIESQREATDLAEREARARDEIGKGYDALIAKQETAAEFERLMAEYRKDHVNATKEETAAFEAQARIEAERV